MKRPVNERVPLQLVRTVNEVWSMDFVSDSLSGGRRLKYLTIADDFSHESVDIAVDFGISGQYVTRVLDRAALFRGYPQSVRTDNGPEFTSRAFMAWAQSHGICHILIQPRTSTFDWYVYRGQVTAMSASIHANGGNCVGAYMRDSSHEKAPMLGARFGHLRMCRLVVYLHDP